ncbi:ribbon-helix-helix domain-containing protein [Enterovirga rhinocerotis]|uniref:Putative DNA-binding ribbon-helix-helix protein n=1 Tax=Enterovirga rhinocerotis TaxID=1339210 RepID=A0A4R7BRT4_9HYPH|nr:ribbon-helix-helix domain-containing protein [Enterovirga rhinocerotis]TDR88101.1 putative DNA-binding ribbon-helix-helix protein [Enterovirga rhinocerotis]
MGAVSGNGPAGGIAKRSVTIAGHRTSVSLEAEFWDALGEIARERGLSLGALVAEIDAGRGTGNLSSALRLHVLAALRAGAQRP